MKPSHWILASCLILSARDSAPASAATLLFSHVDSADPVTEGWTHELAGPGTSAGPISDLGRPVWFTNHGSTALNSGTYYTSLMTTAQHGSAASTGWILRAYMRVPAASVDRQMSFAHYRTNTNKSFQMHFGSTAAGDHSVRLITSVSPLAGPTFTTTGGAGSYHLYDLVYNPGTATADLYVDGVASIAGYAGLSLAATGGVRFGCGISAGVSQANWSEVEFYFGTDRPTPSRPTTWGEIKDRYH